MSDKPTMTVIVAFGSPTSTRTETYEITDDLPADALGENLVDSIQKVWVDGADPTDMTIVVQFGPRSPFRRKS